jgi:hypothetical protein
MINRQLAMIAIVSMFASSVRGDEKAKPVKRTFEITLDVVFDTQEMNKKDHVTSNTRIRYAYERSGSETILSMDAIELKMATNGKLTLETLMNRSRFHFVQDGKTKDYTAENGDERQKAMLHDSFAAPLVKYVVDDAGKETKRTEIAGPGAEFLKKPMIANTRFFHAPFYAGKSKWDADVEIGGSSGVVSGVFTYTRLPAKTKDPAITVSVAGDLQVEVQKNPFGQVVTKRSVSGEQVYSPELREWISGEWTIKMAIEMESSGKKTGSGSGAVIAKMRMLPDK